MALYKSVYYYYYYTVFRYLQNGDRIVTTDCVTSLHPTCGTWNKYELSQTDPRNVLCQLRSYQLFHRIASEILG